MFLIGILLTSCSEDSEDELPPNFEGYSYLPLEVGQERIFRIDSISYDDFTGMVDTTVYFERTSIESTESDLQGRINYRTEIYRRNADSLAWQLRRTEFRYRGTYRYELNRGGIILLPLVFPPLQESRWNVNALNAQNEATYQYRRLNQAFQLEGLTFDSSITVLQKDVLNLINREKALEVYASGVGMIYSEDIDLETDINSGEIISGYERYRRLIQP